MNEAQHTAVRRSVGSAFTTNSLLDYEESIDTTLMELVDSMEQAARSNDGKIDMTHWMQLFAIDVLMQIAFSESLGFMKTGGDVEGVLAAIVGRFDHWGHWAAAPELDYVVNKSKLSSYLRTFGMTLSRLWQASTPETSGNSPLASVGMAKLQSRSIANEKEKKEGLHRAQTDLLDKFLTGQATHPSLLSDPYLLGIVMSTIGAGADTTGGTLTYTLYLLAKNPHAKEKLYAELRDALAQGTVASSNSGAPKWRWNEVNTKLPYLDAVLKESMRLIPIAAWGLDRVVPAQVTHSLSSFSDQTCRLISDRVPRFVVGTFLLVQ